MTYVIVNITLTLFALMSMILLAHKQRIGFLTFLVVECCYLYIGITTQQFGLILVPLVYLFVDVYAYKQWGHYDKVAEKDIK